ncbi:hypothetical protein CEQ90_12905 [Lewinellaceae bacterium SD302]|nr:hypothetical protein CEQ90_12905 [Lewinellaceae bacterium SD302]
MKFIFSLVSGLMCLCLTLNLHAQIQTRQAYGTPLTNERSVATASDLFTQLPERAPENQLVDDNITEFQLMALNVESLTELKARAAGQLELEIPGSRGSMTLRLERAYPLSVNFRLRTASGRIANQSEAGIHYRGRVVGRNGSHVALSLLDGELTGLIAGADGQNLVLGKLREDDRNATTYILYQDDPVFASQELDCATEDTNVDYLPEMLEMPATPRSVSNNCVGVYFEVDYNIYQEKGINTAGYVTAAFNEVAALYAASNVDLTISEIFVWDTPSPYGGTSSGTLLTQFQQHRPSFNGDVAQLLSYSASGGIAVLNGLCHPISAARMSFSSIGSNFQTVPTYSWTIMVIAHELGHLLGSQHTHACVWNGNGTAIDGCAGFTEGSCPNPGNPSNGGNIMSYCHLTGAGINFNVGFGTQPASVIFNTINAASCIAGNTCGGNPPPPPPPPTDECEDYVVVLELTLDHFGMETTWTLEDENQQVLASGGPYGKKLSGTVIRDTFCLVEDCYVFRLEDEDDDGICCEYGEGGYLLTGPDGEILAEGAEFEDAEVTDFCLPDGEPPVSNEECIELNFNEYPVISYGMSQDVGQHTVSNSGNTLEIRNNAWKGVELAYDITPETILEFDFRSTIEGEIHGIGFDDNLGISPEFTFRLHGTQTWGNGDFDNYADNGQWQHYVIPVGDYLSGEASYLFFSADHDLGARNGNSFYQNVRIYESEPCDGNSQSLPASVTGQLEESISVSPNPAGESLQLRSITAGTYEIVSTTGQQIATGQAGEGSTAINVTNLSPGAYFLRFTATDGNMKTLRFTRAN